jgi:hypothetical protein
LVRAQVGVAVSVLIQAGRPVTVGAEVAAVLALVVLVVWEQQAAASMEQHAMCPLIDMFNHSGAVQVSCVHGCGAGQ